MVAEGLSVRFWRLHLLITLLLGCSLALALRVAQLQIAEYEFFKEKAQAEHWARETVIAHRGAIRDRNGRPLATTVEVFDVLAHTDAIRNPERTARLLAPLLRRPEREVAAQLKQRRDPGRPLLLQRQVPYPMAQEITELGLFGIKLEKRIKRAYPEGSLASSLLGFVGRDHIGLAGIEMDFNGELMGRHGTLVYERDSIGAAIPVGYRQLTPPQPGADLILTIDRFIQRLAEQELDRAIAKHSASGGSVIVMEPYTGEILALASRPSFDLSKLDLAAPPKAELFRNRAITDLYEPGSAFKVITMATALDQKVVTPQTTYRDTGVVVKYGWPIYNWNNAANGVIDMTELLKRSANVGAVWVSDRLGPERFYTYVHGFGFGERSNVDLAGEAKGQVRDHQTEGWRPIDLNTNSFGQGISVTPLQLITAVAAVANGGLLMRPYVVKEIHEGKAIRTFQPVVVRRVISEETARTLTEMLHAAAEKGESRYAIVPGYKVAGKTGTANIPDPKGYTTERTIGSFVGFAPYEDPKIAVLVKVDEPKDIPWGSVVASPVFSAIVGQALPYLKVPPAQAKYVRAAP